MLNSISEVKSRSTLATSAYENGFAYRASPLRPDGVTDQALERKRAFVPNKVEPPGSEDTIPGIVGRGGRIGLDGRHGRCLVRGASVEMMVFDPSLQRRSSLARSKRQLRLERSTTSESSARCESAALARRRFSHTWASNRPIRPASRSRRSLMRSSAACSETTPWFFVSWISVDISCSLFECAQKKPDTGKKSCAGPIPNTDADHSAAPW